MNTIVREMPELELALLKRSLGGLADSCERCGGCRRSLLIGERLYVYESGTTLCELCRNRDRTTPSESHIVHGPEFGHTCRVLDLRSAA